MSLTWPNRHLTLEEWAELPEAEGVRVELVEGLVVKFSEYADAGIPQYWIVDLGSPTTLLAYQLVDGNYEHSGEHTGQVELSVAGHRVSVDLDALTRR